MIFHIAVCAGDPALRAVLRRHCEDYFARRATGCAVACFDSPEALLEQERLGRLKIVRYSEMTAESLAWVEAAETVTILEHGLLHEDGAFARYMREKYPRSWEQAQAREKEREAQP